MGFLDGVGGWLGDQFGFGNPGASGLNFDINRKDFDVPQFDQQFGQYSNLSQQLGARQAPRAGTFTANETGPFAGQQSQLSNLLMQQAQGRGPGQQAARMQAQAQADQIGAQAQGMAARAPGAMGALAGRNAAMAGAQAQSNVGQQAALAGVQAQLGATGQLGNVLAQARGQNQNMSQFNASQRQQGGQFNTNAALQQTGMNDQAMLEALRQRMQLSGMQQQGGMGFWDARTRQAIGQSQVPSFLDKLLQGGQSAMRAGAMAGGGG